MKKTTLLLIYFAISVLGYSQNTVLNFDGTTNQQYMETNTMIPLTNSFTAMGWVDVNAGHTQIFTWGSSTVNKYIQIKTSFDYKFEVYVPLGVLSFKSTTSILGGWHHVAVTNDAGSFKIYVDGVEEATATANLSTIAPTKTSFGSALLNGTYQGTGNYDIDEFSIWDIALTGTQIATYKNTPPTGLESGLVAAYNFNPDGVTPNGNNSALTTLTDLTGNYPATLTGFPLTGSTGNYIVSTNSTLGLSKLGFKNTKFVITDIESNYIKVKGINITTNYNIYSLLGANVLNGSLNVDDVIDINSLNKGLYVLFLDNNQSFKFIKN